MSIDDKNHNTLVDFVWNNEVAVQLIFDRRAGTIKRYHVEGLMLQLFSVGVLQFTHVKKDGSGLIILAREKVFLVDTTHARGTVSHQQPSKLAQIEGKTFQWRQRHTSYMHQRDE